MNKTSYLALGAFFIAAFFGLTETEIGLEVGFTPGRTNSKPQEFYFWLGSAFLLLPGAILATI